MLLAILAFILTLGVLIFVHEAGHFIVARRAGIAASEFGFGFPPRIVGIQRVGRRWRVLWGNEKVGDDEPTVYSINWIPLGGFVRIKGEDGTSASEPSSFGSKSRGVRALVLAAGVGMNLVLAVVLFSAVAAIGVPQVLEDVPAAARVRDRETRVIGILKDSPAAAVGIQPGDAIASIDGQAFTRLEDVQRYIREHADAELAVTLRRDRIAREVRLRPVLLREAQRPGIGVQLVETGVVSFPIHQAVVHGVRTTGVVVREIVVSLGQLVRGLIIERRVAVDVAGPVGIAVLTGQVVQLGAIYLVQFAAVLSANLALINVLPFPALDGGRLLFLLIEAIRRRPLAERVTRAANAAGYAVLLLLVIVITFHDLRTFGSGILSAIRTASGF